MNCEEIMKELKKLINQGDNLADFPKFLEPGEKDDWPGRCEDVLGKVDRALQDEFRSIEPPKNTDRFPIDASRMWGAYYKQKTEVLKKALERMQGKCKP